jgi:cob(I)alamin adenosyltransferase
MGNRLTKIYTRTGDDGTTGLGDGTRVDKSSVRIEVIGDIDELNSLLGLLLTKELDTALRELLLDCQHALFDAGGELSLPDNAFIKPGYVIAIEQAIDRYNSSLPALKEFILPGGNEAAAICHVARAVCRRVERHLVKLNESTPVNSNTLMYFNRLSDLLFVVARTLARNQGGAEVYWEKERLNRQS